MFDINSLVPKENITHEQRHHHWPYCAVGIITGIGGVVAAVHWHHLLATIILLAIAVICLILVFSIKRWWRVAIINPHVTYKVIGYDDTVPNDRVTIMVGETLQTIPLSEINGGVVRSPTPLFGNYDFLAIGGQLDRPMVRVVLAFQKSPHPPFLAVFK